MKAKKISLTLLIFFYVISSLFAQSRPFPYELNKKDYWLLPLGVGMTALGKSLSENQAPITLFLPNGEDVLVLEKKGQRVFIATAPANVILGKADNYLHGRFKFFKELGTFWMWDLCDCGGVDWRPSTTPEPSPTPDPIPTRPPEDDGSPVQPAQ